MTRISTRGKLAAASTPVVSVLTVIGGEIKCRNYDTLNIWVSYTKGDETSVTIIPFSLPVSGGDQYQLQTWAGDGTLTRTLQQFSLTGTGTHLITLDVTGTDFVVIKQVSVGSPPTGTIEVDYTIAGV